MATRQTRVLAKAAVGPSVLVLFVWMIVPLVLTLYFSLAAEKIVQLIILRNESIPRSEARL